jgi:ribosomal protein L40E
MSPREHPNYHDYEIATMYRVDPEKLAQIRRIMSGMTRCPECDALNSADQKRCEKCGAKLYPEVEDEEPAKEEEPYVPPKEETKEKDKKTAESDKPPYY